MTMEEQIKEQMKQFERENPDFTFWALQKADILYCFSIDKGLTKQMIQFYLNEAFKKGQANAVCV